MAGDAASVPSVYGTAVLSWRAELRRGKVQGEFRGTWLGAACTGATNQGGFAVKRAAVLPLLLLVCGACSERKPPEPVKIPDVVIVDYHDWLKDGASVSWKLDPGRYKIEMTANGDGCSLEWAGGTCPGTKETHAYSVLCEMAQTGQVIVTNPTTFGLGASSSVTVKITRLGT